MVLVLLLGERKQTGRLIMNHLYLSVVFRIYASFILLIILMLQFSAETPHYLALVELTMRLCTTPKTEDSSSNNYSR